MTDSAAVPATAASRHRGGDKIAIAAVKILITAACFWYLSRQIDAVAVFSGIAIMDLRWLSLATLLVMLEMLLVGTAIFALRAISRRKGSLAGNFA